MKLKELLRTIPDDEYVYIGSKSGFVCICKCSEAEKELRKKSKYYFDTYSEQKRTAEVRIESHPKIMKRYRDALNEALEKNDSANIRKMKSTLLKADAEYKYQVRNLGRLKKIVSGYKKFIDREVIDTYKRKWIEPLGTVILVEGVENGPYWSLDEVEKE